MQITEDNQDDDLSRGKVLHFSGRRREISKVLSQINNGDNGHPTDGPYYVFHSPPHRLRNLLMRTVGLIADVNPKQRDSDAGRTE
jgi:hypothetical protein